MYIRSPDDTPIQGVAWFSTGGGIREPRAAVVNSMPCVARSDPVKDTNELIRKLRTEWPVFCHSIFPGWDVRDFWDEYDFYLQGGEFLYNTIYKIMEQNIENVSRFCLAWIEAHKSQWLALCSMFTKPEALSTGTIFNDLDRQKYGEVFLGYALNHLVSAYERTCQLESDQANIQDTKQTAGPAIDETHQNTENGSAQQVKTSQNNDEDSHLSNINTQVGEAENVKFPNQDENVGLRKFSDSSKHVKACTPKMQQGSPLYSFPPETGHETRNFSGSPYQNQPRVNSQFGTSGPPQGHLVTYYSPHVSPGAMYSNMDTVTMFVTQAPSQILHNAGVHTIPHHESSNIVQPYPASHQIGVPSHANGIPNQHSTNQRPQMPLREPSKPFHGESHIAQQQRPRRGSKDFGRTYRGPIGRGRGRAASGNFWRESRRSSLGQNVEINDNSLPLSSEDLRITPSPESSHIVKQGHNMHKASERQPTIANESMLNLDSSSNAEQNNQYARTLSTDASGSSSAVSVIQPCCLASQDPATLPSNSSDTKQVDTDHSSGNVTSKQISNGIEISGLMSLFVGNIGTNSREEVLAALNTVAKVTRVTIQEKQSFSQNYKGPPRFNRFAFAEFVNSEETKKMLEHGTVLCGDRRLDCQIPNRWLQERGMLPIERPDFNYKSSPGSTPRHDANKTAIKDPSTNQKQLSTTYSSQDVRSSIYNVSHSQRQPQEPSLIIVPHGQDTMPKGDKTAAKDITTANKPDRVVCLPSTLKPVRTNMANANTSFASTLRGEDTGGEIENTENRSNRVNSDDRLHEIGELVTGISRTCDAQIEIQGSPMLTRKTVDQHPKKSSRGSSDETQLQTHQSPIVAEKFVGSVGIEDPQQVFTRNILMDIPEHKALEMPNVKSATSLQSSGSAIFGGYVTPHQEFVAPKLQVQQSHDVQLQNVTLGLPKNNTGSAIRTNGVQSEDMTSNAPEEARKPKPKRNYRKKVSVSMKQAQHTENIACENESKDLRQTAIDVSKTTNLSTNTSKSTATNTLFDQHKSQEPTAMGSDLNPVGVDSANEMPRGSSSIIPLQEWNKEFESASSLLQHLTSPQRQPLAHELDKIRVELTDLEDRISDATLKANQGTMSIRKKNLKKIKTATEHHKAKIEELVFLHARILHGQMKPQQHTLGVGFEAKTTTVIETNTQCLKKAPPLTEDPDAFLPDIEGTIPEKASNSLSVTAAYVKHGYNTEPSEYSTEVGSMPSGSEHDLIGTGPSNIGLGTLSTGKEVEARPEGSDIQGDGQENFLCGVAEPTVEPANQDNEPENKRSTAMKVDSNDGKTSSNEKPSSNARPSNDNARPSTLSWAKVVAGTSKSIPSENQTSLFQSRATSQTETSTATAAQLGEPLNKLKTESKPATPRANARTDPWCVPAKDIWQKKSE